MNLVNLRYNSLFIRYFRERMRPHVAGSYAAVVFVSAALFLISGKESFTNIRWERFLLASLPRWEMSEMFFGLALMQGALLLLLGTLSAYRMALLDRLNGILDLFRATPTTGVNHVIGMVFGAPVTEWLLFFLLTPVSLAVALMGGVKLAAAASFYASLLLCAIFYHSAGILVGVCASHRQPREAISFAVLLIFFHVFAVLGAVAGSPIAYHATCLPVFVNLMSGIGMESAPPPFADGAGVGLLFGARVPSLLFQALVQLPLIVFACLALDRKISGAAKPILSRSQLLVLTALFLFFFLGHLSFNKELDSAGGPDNFNLILFAFSGLVFVCSAAFSVFITPTALCYRKGLNRMKKLGLPRLSPFDEQAGSLEWMLLYCGLVAPAFFALCVFFDLFLPVPFLSFVILSCFILWQASALEFFRLRFPGKETVLTTAFLLLWIAVPIAELVLTKAKYICLTFLSPLAMIPLWCGAATSGKISHEFRDLIRNIDLSKIDFSMSELGKILSKIYFGDIDFSMIELRKIFSDIHFRDIDFRPLIAVLLVILGHLCLLGLTALCIYLAARERKRLRAGVDGIPEPPVQKPATGQP